MQLSEAIQHISTFKSSTKVQKFRISYENEAKMNYYSFDIFRTGKYNKN